MWAFHEVQPPVDLPLEGWHTLNQLGNNGWLLAVQIAVCMEFLNSRQGLCGRGCLAH